MTTNDDRTATRRTATPRDSHDDWRRALAAISLIAFALLLMVTINSYFAAWDTSPSARGSTPFAWWAGLTLLSAFIGGVFGRGPLRIACACLPGTAILLFIALIVIA